MTFNLPPFLNDLLKSRRFWASATSIILVVFKDQITKLGLSEEQVSQVVLVVASWVVGESLRSSSTPKVEVDSE
jgi:hypothetical protein